jgi:hypothetical protein
LLTAGAHFTAPEAHRNMIRERTRGKLKNPLAALKGGQNGPFGAASATPTTLRTPARNGGYARS